MASKRFNAYQWDRKMEKVTDVLETIVKKVQAVAQVAPGRGHRLVVKDSPAKIPAAVRVVFAPPDQDIGAPCPTYGSRSAPSTPALRTFGQPQGIFLFARIASDISMALPFCAMIDTGARTTVIKKAIAAGTPNIPVHFTATTATPSVAFPIIGSARGTLFFYDSPKAVPVAELPFATADHPSTFDMTVYIVDRFSSDMLLGYGTTGFGGSGSTSSPKPRFLYGDASSRPREHYFSPFVIRLTWLSE
ncbi:hypothetical protein FOZ60_011249 [Perkinsus olseni]|uniref:Uncharacterized protein n=1 Tax=Perkinsus olseni TaxID=32597 RepID=A0A7J6NE02_PEROL|nr:hypothetical protein FOZ60_011249 [Perkinsus olseni]